MLCGECFDAGRHSRLLYSQSSGNGGIYEYYICTSKQRRLCSTPAVRLEIIEAYVIKTIAAERFDTQAIDDLSEIIAGAVDDLLAADRDTKVQPRKQLENLEAQEDRLFDLAANGTIAVPKLSAKIVQTTLQKEAIKEKLAGATDRLKYGTEKALAYLELLRDPGELYRDAPDDVRRDLLAAFFNMLIVYVEADQIRVESDRVEANTALRELRAHVQLAREQHTPGLSAETCGWNLDLAA